ncbi:uncharacterized protein METZ01_LOCUS182510, partial [marine metagenome]
KENDYVVQGDSISLTLKDTIIRTLTSNVTIAVEEINSKVKTEGVIENKSEFDATFEIDLSVNEKTQQQASAFSSPNKSRNKNHNWDISFAQKLATGANYEFNFTNKRNKSNSKTLGLNPNYSSNFEFSLTQPLLKNFGVDLNKRNIYIAQNEVDISEYDFKAKIIDVVSKVENAYWDLVFSIEDLEVKKKTLERARDLERNVKAQVSVGKMAEIEILQAKSDVASREESLLVSQDLILDNEDNLKNILNINFSSSEGRKNIYPSDRPDMIIEKIDLNVAIKESLLNRPDYHGKKKELENQNILVKYQENQTYPSVDLMGSLGLNGLSGDAINVTSGTFTGKSAYGGGYGQSLSDSLSTQFYNWEFGVKFSYPLGNRSAKSQLAASRLEAAQLILSIKELEKEIILEVREAIRQLKTDVKRVQASRIAKRLSEKKLEAEEKKFEVGLSTSFNVLEFQEDLAEEQSKEIKAIVDYNKSRVRFHQVTATTLKTHDIKLQAKEIS